MSTSTTTSHIKMGLFGLTMGYALSRIGFSDFGEVHRLFTFADLRLLLTFGSAVMLSMVGFAIFARGKKLPKKPLHKGTVAGGILFGTGWAITGACPSIALVQLGQGYLPAIFTIFGILFGVWVYPKVHARFFGWDTGACNV
ncbi:MAG: YeeE/YedE family protein [Gammaproteobacteria bacterium]|nr:YeeE/YedE family protein [Gammaproteobacteria bacterium]